MESHEELMLAYADGDSSAFTRLYALHKGPLFRFILRQGITDTRAEELFQEIWLKVINARHQYKASARFQTWLYKIARNRLIDEYRNVGNSVDIDTDEEEHVDLSQPSAELQLDQERTKAEIIEAVGQLAFEQRQSFLLKYDAGMNNEDIAKVTGTNTETAKSRVRYAINNLKKMLGGIK